MRPPLTRSWGNCPPAARGAANLGGRHLGCGPCADTKGRRRPLSSRDWVRCGMESFHQHGEPTMTTPRRAVLAGGGLLPSTALLRDIPIAAAQPVDAGGAPEPAVSALETA